MSGYTGVSIPEDVKTEIDEIAKELSKTLGLKVSRVGAIKYLINQYKEGKK